MLKPEEIPIEVLEAALDCWNTQSRDTASSYTKDMRLVIAAAINAWPGLEQIYKSEDEKVWCFILNMQRSVPDV